MNFILSDSNFGNKPSSNLKRQALGFMQELEVMTLGHSAYSLCVERLST